MAGRGPTPNDRLPQRPRDAKKRVRSWTHAEGAGWRYGKSPVPPAGLLPVSKTAWRLWFGSWMAAHWVEADVPSLRLVIRLYDQVERGEFVRAGELRLWMDTYGLTPKGQQDRRWKEPERSPEPAIKNGPSKPANYLHLRAVDDLEP